MTLVSLASPACWRARDVAFTDLAGRGADRSSDQDIEQLDSHEETREERIARYIRSSSPRPCWESRVGVLLLLAPRAERGDSLTKPTSAPSSVALSKPRTLATPTARARPMSRADKSRADKSRADKSSLSLHLFRKNNLRALSLLLRWCLPVSSLTMWRLGIFKTAGLCRAGTARAKGSVLLRIR
jgi:hypothetical protein